MSGAASVNVKEVDLSTRVASFEGVFGAIVIQTKKGQTNEPFFVSSDTQFLNVFTPSARIKVGYDLAYFSALAYLERSNKLWVQRAINSGYYSGAVFHEATSLLNNSGIPSATNLADPTSYVFTAEQALLFHSANEGAWGNEIGISIITIEDEPDLIEENSFLVRVFKSDNLATPVEEFLVSRVEGQRDGTGRNMFIEDVLKASQFVRVISNPLIDGEVLPKSGSTATFASATYEGATYTAVNAGSNGNDIELVFDGIADIDTVVGAWNTANPTNTVGFTGALGTDVPTAGTVELSGGSNALTSPIVFLNDGNDGLAVADSNMISAANLFSNKAKTNITLFMDGGYTTPAYQTALNVICQSRQDCVAILSVPYEDQVSANYLNDIVDYRKLELNMNSSYAALYVPHLQIADRFNDRQIWISPDGHVAGSVSFSSQNFEIWYPAAGFKRGVLNVLDTRIRFEDGELDVLYNAGINPIRFMPGRGIVVWGQKTLLSRASALDRLNVRLLLIVITPAVKEFLENFLFDLNEPAVRGIIVGQLEDYFEGIRTRKGITDFEVVSDSTNNSDADTDANRLNVDIFIKPTRSIETIPVRLVITPTGISFGQAASAI